MPLFYTSELFDPNFNFIEQIYKRHLDRHLARTQRGYLDIQHGRKVLASLSEVDLYVGLYAASHEQKLTEAYDALNLSRLQGKIVETISYGCGAATDSNALISYLMSKKIDLCLQRITLIEPSLVALNCGVEHIQRAMLDANQPFTIRAYPKYLEHLTPNDLVAAKPTTKLHVFSNILDVEQVDLEKLASTVATSSNGENFFICVSPNLPGSYNGKERIDKFYNLLSQQLKLVNIDINGRSTRVHSYNHKQRKYEFSSVSRYHRIFHTHAA